MWFLVGSRGAQPACAVHDFDNSVIIIIIIIMIIVIIVCIICISSSISSCCSYPEY